jgi:ketosteroid isomerase-like protein
MGMPGMQMGDHSSPAFKVRDAWQSAWNKRDLKTMLGLYAESAIIITADGRFITGRQSIREHFQHLLAAQKNEMTLTSAGSDAAENQIVNFGSFAEEQPTRIEGATKVKFGKYLIVLRLVGSEWKIKEQVMIQSPQDARR